MKAIIIAVLLLCASCSPKIHHYTVKDVQVTQQSKTKKAVVITKQDWKIFVAVFIIGYVFGDHYKEDIKKIFE